MTDGNVCQVYNCRTPNSWDSDLALSATSYPQRGLTFAILYGSTFTIEKAILERLRSINIEAAHPLLLPGIFAELELSRHTRIVEASINEIEAKIFELNFQSSSARDYRRSEVESLNESKRTAWLDLTYLRNSLTTWSTQLLKMARHAEFLNRESFILSKDTKPFPTELPRVEPVDERDEIQLEYPTISMEYEKSSKNIQLEASTIRSGSQNSFAYRRNAPLEQLQDVETPNSDDSYIKNSLYYEDEDFYLKQMHKVGEKIKVRLAAIRDEYDEKIRDCTMRVDGMAMATQWVTIPALTSSMPS